MNYKVLKKSGARAVPYKKWMQLQDLPLGFVNGSPLRNGVYCVKEN